MGACVGLGRIFLVIINGIFAVIGLVFLVVGCVVRFGSDVLDPYLKDFYAALAKFIQQAGDDADLSNFNIGEILKDATLAFILIGVFFFVIGIFGCIGGCCKVRCMLVVYPILIGLIVIGEIVFVILLFTIRDTIDANIKGPMKTSIIDEYMGFNGTNIASLGWNFAMVNYKCCGVDNYTDFNNASRWVRSYSPPGSSTVYTLKAPLTCCKLNGTFPNIVLPSNWTCAFSPNIDISNIGKGCYDAIWDILNDNTTTLIAVGVTVLVIELLMIIFSCVVYCETRKKDEDDFSYDY